MDNIAPVFTLMIVMLIPVVAIVGGITAGIVKSHHRAKMIELAQRERIAAIERGLDVSQLPQITQIPGLMTDGSEFKEEQRQDRRSRLMAVWGLIALGLGSSLMAILWLTVPGHGAWGAGFFPVTLGLALLVSSRIVRPDPEDVKREKEALAKMQMMGHMGGGGTAPPVPGGAAGPGTGE